MSLLLICRADSEAAWANALAERLSDRPFHVWPDGPADPAEVTYIAAAKPPPGEIARYPNLKAVLSLWAGVDHITADPDFPGHLPIARMVEPGLTRGMREFVMAQVLAAHLKLPDYARQQRECLWRPEIRGTHGEEPLAADVTVGVLGLGVLGTDCARALAGLGFNVVGWARSPRTIEGVDVRTGAEALDGVLAASDILVNLLPRTAETEDILDADAFARMPAGAYLINVGRGEHLVEEDLIPALDQGRLAGATLDVFREEPLPSKHPFWGHPKITVTPHVASITRVRTGVDRLIGAMAAFDRGETPPNTFDPARGY